MFSKRGRTFFFDTRRYGPLSERDAITELNLMLAQTNPEIEEKPHDLYSLDAIRAHEPVQWVEGIHKHILFDHYRSVFNIFLSLSLSPTYCFHFSISVFVSATIIFITFFFSLSLTTRFASFQYIFSIPFSTVVKMSICNILSRNNISW